MTDRLPHPVVLSIIKTLIIQNAMFEQFFMPEKGRGVEGTGIFEEHFNPVLFRIFNSVFTGQAALFSLSRTNYFCLRPAYDHIRMALHESILFLQPAGQTDIIAVHPCNVFSLCGSEACIQGFCNAQIFFIAYDPYAGIFQRIQIVSDGSSGSVINDDKFKFIKGLTKDTAYGFFQEKDGCIVDRHDNADFFLKIQNIPLPRV